MAIQKPRRTRRTYSAEFKQQIVEIYNQGKPRQEILKEYELTPSAFDKWVQQFNQTGSFKAKDNESAQDKEIRELKKLIKEKKKLIEEQEVIIYVLNEAKKILSGK